MNIKPISTEKAVRLMDTENTLVFSVGRSTRKENLKLELEKLLDVKVAGIRTLTRQNIKYAYVKLAKTHAAADVATKLGLI